MHRPEVISSALQMYLKTILQLQTDNKVARVKEIAERLGVTGATVSSAIKNLEERGLVQHERYGYVTLTPHGEHLARCVLKRYHVLQDFLVSVLKIDPETADADACLMEHDISPVTLDRMASFIEFLRTEQGGMDRSRKFEEYLRTHPLPANTTAAALCAECASAGTCQMVTPQA